MYFTSAEIFSSLLLQATVHRKHLYILFQITSYLAQKTKSAAMRNKTTPDWLPLLQTQELTRQKDSEKTSSLQKKIVNMKDEWHSSIFIYLSL